MFARSYTYYFAVTATYVKLPYSRSYRVCHNNRSWLQMCPNPAVPVADKHDILGLLRVLIMLLYFVGLLFVTFIADIGELRFILLIQSQSVSVFVCGVLCKFCTN